MKTLNNTMIIVVAIVCTILSYPSWFLFYLIDRIIPIFTLPVESIRGRMYIAFVVLCLILFLACRALYRFYNHTENKHTSLWGQIGFIFLVSFTIKFIIDNLLLLSGSLFGAGAIYGMDIIFIAPIAVFVNLKIANHKRRKTTTKN